MKKISEKIIKTYGYRSEKEREYHINKMQEIGWKAIDHYYESRDDGFCYQTAYIKEQ